MKPATLKALKQSILKWEGIVAGTEKDFGVLNCALCKRFFDTGCKLRGERCPVYEKTGQTQCDGSPYHNFVDLDELDEPTKKQTKARNALAVDMLNFLNGLLP